MAMVRAAIRPPHMPRQCPPPSRPSTSADISSGSSSVTVGFSFRRLCALILLIDASLVLGVLVVEQNAMGRPVEVVVLAAVHRPEENPDGERDQHHGNGYQDVERGHGASEKRSKSQ